MELWIRSQDKTILSKVQNIIIRENQNEKNETNYAILDIYTMGIYKTKERALEVLDEIHQRLIDLETLEIEPNCYKSIKRDIDCAYEMPKE